MVGMGRQLAESVPVAQRLYARAADVLGYDLAELCFNGPENELDSTVISQPALYVTSLAALESLRSNLRAGQVRTTEVKRGIEGVSRLLELKA